MQVFEIIFCSVLYSVPYCVTVNVPKKIVNKIEKENYEKIRQIARSFDIALCKATLGPKIINLLLSSNEKPLKNSLKYHEMMLEL